MNKNLTKIIASTVVVATFALFGVTNVYADCEPTYGGGETCIYNKSFEIEKEVKIEGDNDWKDKVTGVEKGEIVIFRIKIKNVGEVETDDMKMEDFLPDEMERVGGSGLTEYWDDFEPGDTKTFKIEAIVKDSEYEGENFDKCVVNKAELWYDDAFEGADTATVCYGDEELTELPETGAGSTLALLGTALILSGFVIKKSKAK